MTMDVFGEKNWNEQTRCQQLLLIVRRLVVSTVDLYKVKDILTSEGCGRSWSKMADGAVECSGYATIVNATAMCMAALSRPAGPHTVLLRRLGNYVEQLLVTYLLEQFYNTSVLLLPDGTVLCYNCITVTMQQCIRTTLCCFTGWINVVEQLCVTSSDVQCIVTIMRYLYLIEQCCRTTVCVTVQDGTIL